MRGIGWRSPELKRAYRLTPSDVLHHSRVSQPTVSQRVNCNSSLIKSNQLNSYSQSMPFFLVLDDVVLCYLFRHMFYSAAPFTASKTNRLRDLNGAVSSFDTSMTLGKGPASIFAL